MRRFATQLGALTIRALLVTAAWWVLVEGKASAWAYGAPVIVVALLSRTVLAGIGVPLLRLGALARFVCVFISGLVRGGFDVAWRALSPRLPLSPDWIMYDVRLVGEASRRLLMAAASVTPGTLSVDVEGSKLRIHALATAGDDPLRVVRAMEDSIAKAFGEAG